MSLAIGLTGGIASGKSTVTNLFSELGIVIIDADIIAREVVLPEQPGLDEIIREFGERVLDENGYLDRKLLRNIVFSDISQKTRLENILHPIIGQKMLQRSKNASGPYHILDIPLLVNAKHYEFLSRILVVDCAVETQVRRLIARDGESAEQAQRIINSQSTRAARLAIADDVIDNDGQIEAVAQQVYELHQRYLQLSYSPI